MTNTAEQQLPPELAQQYQGCYKACKCHSSRR